MKTNASRSLVASLLLLTASVAMGQVEAPPEVTHDGLQRVPKSKVAAAYVLPGADFSGYDKVMLLDCFVSFKKHWERDHRGASTGDMERIKGRLSDLFRQVFTEVLEEGGYPVVTQPGPDVLLVRPAIIDLDVHAPDLRTGGRSESFVTSAGAATIYVELYDSATSQILARAIDRKGGRDNAGFQMASSVYNSSEARKLLKLWAGLLRDRLNEFRAAKAAQ